MSGGKLLVGLKDITYSEKLLNYKSLLKEEIDVEEQNVKSFNKNTEILEVFSSQTDDLLGNNTSITLTSVRSF